MYRFPDSNNRETLKRRDLLDWYGFIAHVSIQIPLTLLYCAMIILQQRQRRLARKNAKVTEVRSRSLSSWWGKFIWWCCGQFEVAGLHLGTRGVLLGSVIWTVWLFALTFLQTYDDYIHLSGRFGIVGASQLPFHYMLSLKTPHSPVQVLGQTGVRNLVQIHKQLGYIIILFFCLHTALYVNFFIQTKLFLGKITQQYIICGSIGMVAFAVIGLTAIKPVRDWSYRVFYMLHVVLSISLVPLLYLHGQHMRIYLWEVLAIFIVNRLLRFSARATYMGTITKIGGVNLVEIKIPLSTRARQKIISWQPGQYAYVSVTGNPLLEMYRSNPFTIASIAVADEQMRFVARILAGNTAMMTQFHDFEGCLKFSVEGPYGNVSRQKALFDCSRVLFVAGGIGGTFVSPLYRQLLLHTRHFASRDSAINFEFVWIARSMEDVTWALPESGEEKDQFVSRLQIFLTGTASAKPSTIEGHTTHGREEQVCITQSHDPKPPRWHEQKGLLSSDGFSEKGIINGLSVVGGRPDLAKLVGRLFSNSSTERVALVVCGPPQLTYSLHKELGPWVSKGRDCLWWGETFGL